MDSSFTSASQKRSMGIHDEKVNGISERSLRTAVGTMVLPPPPAAPKIERPSTVLDEDKYVESLSKIIERDYFPDVTILKYRNKYLDALGAGEYDLAARLQRKLERLCEPDGVAREEARRARKRQKTTLANKKRRIEMNTVPTPTLAHSRAETPMLVSESFSSTDDSDDEFSDADAEDQESSNGEITKGSLDQFQGKYTSEDNESFNKILDKRNQKNREKHSWIWNNNQIAGDKATKLIEWEKETGKSLTNNATYLSASNMPDSSVALIPVKDSTPGPTSWKTKPNNELMFAPEGLPNQPRVQRTKYKQIDRANTRISHENNINDQQLQTNRGETPSTDDMGDSTPRIRGYSFVSAAPSPSPSEFDAQPMTWASVGATPIVSKFKILDTPKREELHHRLVKRITTQSNIAKLRSISTPKFKSSPVIHKTTVSPAGKRLLESIISSRRRTQGPSNLKTQDGVATRRNMPTPVAGSQPPQDRK
ncbi:nuclear protein DGCR14 [Lipomyces japonicus]|uniref:nuclear protein DGCR14 n=1 Tax=Lipomyces japonicus TaxID=56871 RepID=UPI0034CDD0C7